MKGIEKSQDARVCGLSRLRERAARLNDMFRGDRMPPDTIIAYEIVLILRAASLSFPECMGHALMNDMHESVCKDSGFCVMCDVTIPTNSTTRICGKCEKRVEAFENPVKKG